MYLYTILIQWSDEDNCFVVFSPEFTNLMQPCTHGDTYLEAVQNSQELLELLVETAIKNGETLPKRQKFQAVPVLKAA